MTSDEHPDAGRYEPLAEPPTVPMHRPGQDPDLLWVTSETVRHHDGFGEEPRDELFHSVDYYQILTCPFCEWSKTGPRGRWFGGEVWMDYDDHVSTRHRGTKWATVTVHGHPDHGLEARSAGRHFRRHVETDKVDLLAFALEDAESAHRPPYTATFECGRWRGDLSNARLSDSLNRLIEFEAFSEVEVEWHHRAPGNAASPEEAAEAATSAPAPRAVADGGNNTETED